MASWTDHVRVEASAEVPPNLWALVSGRQIVLGGYVFDVTRFYASLGFTPAPGEGRFAFRERAELSCGVLVRDENRLRDRLYRMWKARRG